MDVQDLRDLQDWNHCIISRIDYFFKQTCIHKSNSWELVSDRFAFKTIDFICLRRNFGSIFGSWVTTLAPFWWPLGARVHSGGSLNVPTLIFIDFLWFLGDLLGSLWSHFSIIYVIWGIKKHAWIAGAILDDFQLEKSLISDVPTSQTHSKNNCVR